jgi:epoxyqueuosine reductase QueG
MEKNKYYSQLKKFCQQQGADLFGVADISKEKADIKLAPHVLAKVDRAVCLGIRLSAGILGELEQAPTRLYFHHYRTLNALLDQTALKIANFIQNKGFCAIPIPASQIVDWQKQTAHLSHKKIGLLAGLGWIGRNNLLVNKKLGSQFRLITILTDMPLPADKPSKETCGTCVLCVTVCPAKAIHKDPAQFDHIKCFEKLKEFQKQHLVEQYICGVCINVCKGKVR